MLRTVAIAISALFFCASTAWAQYTYDDVEAATMRRLDGNQDGVISQAEHAAYFRMWPSPPPMSDFDANRNGVLDGSELREIAGYVSYDYIECDANMDYRFSGTELSCVGAYLP